MDAPGDCNPLMGLGSMGSAALELLGVLVTADEDIMVMKDDKKHGAVSSCAVVCCVLCARLRCGRAPLCRQVARGTESWLGETITTGMNIEDDVLF